MSELNVIHVFLVDGLTFRNRLTVEERFKMMKFSHKNGIVIDQNI